MPQPEEHKGSAQDPVSRPASALRGAECEPWEYDFKAEDAWCEETAQAESVEGRHEVALIEEVPGVPEAERWFIYERGLPGKMGRGTLWKGPTRDAGLSWAAENFQRIDTVEHFEP